VLCRRWNWRESDKTKLTESTSNAIVVLEGFDKNIETATEELALLIEKYCSCRTQKFLTDITCPQIEFSV
jgi:DNA/RNA-binding domain of Phe-tRNA-synthetase-like protein